MRYLNNTYEENGEVKSLGAKYDEKSHSWYVSDERDYYKFAKWLNCLDEDLASNLFAYLKEVAKKVGLTVTNEETNIVFNILLGKYEKIKFVSEDTVLARYLNPTKQNKNCNVPETIIYPFGLNQSQKLSVERALSNSVSIIQGPPGTGKTQTILNIIANLVVKEKTVAVVSSNNSATHNVVEKLEKKDVSFLTAFLGNKNNKEKFIKSQTGTYPDMSTWKIPLEEKRKLEQEITLLSKELNEMLNSKNRIAKIEEEFLKLDTERHYFDDYCSSQVDLQGVRLENFSSKKILSLWTEFEQRVERDKRLNYLQKILIVFRYNYTALKLFNCSPETVIPYLQYRFYVAKRRELEKEKNALELKLERYDFDAKMNELTEKSLKFFLSDLESRYSWKDGRKSFKDDCFYRGAEEFVKEYPVVLSTTYSIKGNLLKNHNDYIYDYLIVDEASQVDLATGFLALSCARNIVIVGDLKQLPNVLKQNVKEECQTIWQKYSLDDMYCFTKHSLLSSALEVWKNVPVTLLKEHYRCHPKIINFCNQKFYNGDLVIMTKDGGESDVLTLYKTVGGNHSRGHINQRQIDVIKEEILPKLNQEKNYSIGIISPYRDQVNTLQEQLGNKYEIDTVHKFQGREKDHIILTSVDDEITNFVDDPNMLNVAVSRAVHSISVVMSNDSYNDRTLYGDLMRYIEYNNFEVVQSKVYSIFDMLYKEYANQREEYLKKHKRVSNWDSENLLYSVIQEALSLEIFSNIACTIHYPLNMLVKSYDQLTEDECIYARNQLTHVDFLLFYKMNKAPVLAIEVDGTNYHCKESEQWERDIKKNTIMKKCGIPLLRLRTDGSNEKNKIISELQKALKVQIAKR